MKNYFKLIITSLYLLTSNCFAIIVVDISQCNHHFTYDDGQKRTATRSVRVVTFDTDEQQLISLQYLLAPSHRAKEKLKTKLDSCTVEYGFAKNSTTLLDIAITPTPPHGKGYWYRSLGKVLGYTGLHNLSEFDTTRQGWKFLVISKHDTLSTIKDLASWLNKHTIISDAQKKRMKKIERLRHQLELEEAKKKSTKKTTIKEKLEKEESVVPKRPPLKGKNFPVLLYYGEDKSTEVSNFFIPEYESQRGDLGELCCDLTMMLTQAFVKLDGKCGSNNGFDGLYEHKDIIIVSESKFHQEPPTLDEIIAKEIKPKFSITDKRAITLVSADIKEKILKASKHGKLHLLAYVLLKNGKVDCRLSSEPYEVPLPKEAKAEPMSNLYKLFGSLTPDSSKKEKQQFWLEAIRSVMKTTGMTADEAEIDFLAAIKQLKKPAAAKKLLLA